jgi:HAD superfamily hydrolase (TIGR01509 family)
MKTILVDAVYTFVSEEGVIFDDLYKLLEQYPNRKIILTNAPFERFEQYGLYKVPYEVFTLQRNPMKSEPQYFEMMFEKFNLTKNEVVYFEHDREAVESAKSLGITSYLYDKEKRNLVLLKEFLDSNLER